MDLLQGRTLQKGNDTVAAEVALKKKLLILYYFTSLKCEACRAFDEKIKSVHQEALVRKFELAVIVVSVDTDKESFKDNIQSNYNEFYHIRFGDDVLHLILYNYGVTHVPSLIVVRKNGHLVTKDGKTEIEKIGVNVLVTWSE